MQNNCTCTTVCSCRHVVPLPFLSSLNTNTALLPVNTHKSRALLSIEDSHMENKQRSHALMAVSTSLTNYNMDTEFKRPKRTVARPKVLSGLTSHTCSCPSRNYTDSIDGKQSHNRTLFKEWVSRWLLKILLLRFLVACLSLAWYILVITSYKNIHVYRINGQLLDCLKVEQAGFSSVPFSSSDDKLTKVSV